MLLLASASAHHDGVIRRPLEKANELRLLQGLQGYATSLAARRDREQFAEAMEDLGTLVTDYLASRGRDFSDEVKLKQARQRGVSAFLEEVL